MTQRILCTGNADAHRVTLHVAPGVTLHLSPAVNVAAILAEPAAFGWPMSDAECAATLPPLCGIRTWLHEYRSARNAGADDSFAAAAADVVAYGVRYAVGLEWNEEEIQGDWRD